MTQFPSSWHSQLARVMKTQGLIIIFLIMWFDSCPICPVCAEWKTQALLRHWSITYLLIQTGLILNCTAFATFKQWLKIWTLTDAENLQMWREIRQSCVLLLGCRLGISAGWFNLAKSQSRRVLWAISSWETRHPPFWHKLSLSKLSQSFLHQSYTGSKLLVLGSWKPTSKCHGLPLQEDSVTFNYQHELFWKPETLTGQTGKQNGSQTPIHLHDSFPKTTGSVHWDSQ